jgi:spermidine synthase
MPLLNSLYVTVSGGAGITGILFRGLAAAIILLPPTLLMGATLPAISRWVESTPEGVSWLGFFYGGNIGGGVLGSLAAGFYLLRVYDLGIATYVAIALNVIVALLAITIATATPVPGNSRRTATRRPAGARRVGDLRGDRALGGDGALVRGHLTRLLSLPSAAPSAPSR